MGEENCLKTINVCNLENNCFSKVFIFFRTYDPIADMINAVCADTIQVES
jgi:hypothetical protein